MSDTDQPLTSGKRLAPRPTKKGRERVQADNIWKELLEAFLEAFMQFFFAKYCDDFDWSRGYESLDKEMVEITEESGFGKQSADKLFRVYFKNGEEQLVLLHIEIQGYKDKDFTWRVYNYNDLIRRKYGKEVLSFAILSDPDKDFRPTGYEWRYREHHRLYEFPMVKLLDMADSLEDLKQDLNPFALIVFAHLQTQRLKNRPIELKEAKTLAARLLFARGYNREYVLKLFRAINWLVKLPEPLQNEFKGDIRSSNQEKGKMSLPITDFEKDAIRYGIKKGRKKGLQQGHNKGLQQGRKKGMATLVEKQLSVKFGELEPELAQQIEALDAAQLESLGIAQLNFNSKTELTDWLAKTNLCQS